MTLNDFIARAVAFFDKAEPALAVNPDLSAKLKETEAALTSAVSAAVAAEKTAKDLTAKLETALAEVAAKTAEVATLKAEVEKATKKADEALAGMGVDPKTIPAGKPDAAAGGPDVLARLEAISDPRERAEFFAKNKDAIYRAAQNRK